MEASGQNHALAALPPRKEVQYPQNRRAPCFGGEKNLLLLQGLKPSIIQPIPQSMPTHLLFFDHIIYQNMFSFHLCASYLLNNTIL
jgi:hypothetical protein